MAKAKGKQMTKDLVRDIAEACDHVARGVAYVQINFGRVVITVEPATESPAAVRAEHGEAAMWEAMYE